VTGFASLNPSHALPGMPVGPDENQRPEHFVLRARRIGRRDSHAGYAAIEHVGAMRR